jgi:hypothetical protein
MFTVAKRYKKGQKAGSGFCPARDYTDYTNFFLCDSIRFKKISEDEYIHTLIFANLFKSQRKKSV